MMKQFSDSILLIIILLTTSFTVFSQDAVTPLEIRIESTFHNIGFHWSITGDENLNSQMTIEFREVGDEFFLPTYRTMRAFPESNVDGNLLNDNYHAGSIVGLKPDTHYDVRLTLIDEDGGGLVESIIEKTKTELPQRLIGNEVYVVPGDGGGLGTFDNPYLGMQTACDASIPGDLIILSSGTYQAFELNNNGTASEPIMITADPMDDVIIDGGNTDRGVITLGVFDDSLMHVIIENLTIQNGKWGIDAQNTQYLTVRHCLIQDVDYGIVNRRANGWDHSQTFSDNVLIGRNDWPAPSGFIPSERGIDIRGNANVVRYNTISQFGDGVSTNGPLGRISYSMDIHNNDIFNIGDDLIEVDDMVSNTRVYENRCTNGRMGISLAPVHGGPCYVFRNVFVNMELSTYKMNRKPAGLIIVHNSATKYNRGSTSNSGWQNTIFRNNALAAGHYCFEEYGLADNSLFDDWDYNAYYSTLPGVQGSPWFKWENIRYNRLVDLQTETDIEHNSIEFTPANDITNIQVPTDYITEIDRLSYDYSLTENSSLRDQGEVISNLNNQYVVDGKPDIGAFEFEQPTPHYGPRPVEPWITSNLNDFNLGKYSVQYDIGSQVIKIESSKDIKYLTIYDSNGKVISNFNSNSKHLVVSTSSMTPGVYIVHLNFEHSIKVIVH